MSAEQIDPRDRTHRLSLFLSGVMSAAESIALRHPGKDGSKNVTRDRLMTARISGMIAELETLIENTVATIPDGGDGSARITTIKELRAQIDYLHTGYGVSREGSIEGYWLKVDAALIESILRGETR